MGTRVAIVLHLAFSQQAVNRLNFKFDQLIVGYFLGDRLLGYYSLGDNLAALPTRESTIPLAQGLFPAFAV
jgi:lipopolysaccharide exporter